MQFDEKNPKWFYDKKDFLSLLPLEENFHAVVSELKTLKEKAAAGFWHVNYPEYVQSTTNNKWKAFSFRFFGIKNTLNCSACPVTAGILDQIPEVITADFSYLPPHTHIKPHTGFTKMVLRVHLGLIIPKDCGLRVGDEIRFWEEGKLLIFDDSFEHEAWNNSGQDRYILMIDIPNPLWGYTAREICKYKIETLKDEYMLSLFPKEKWLSFLEKGEMDISPGN